MSKFIRGFDSYNSLSKFFFSVAKKMQSKGECSLGGNALLERFAKEEGFFNRDGLKKEFEKHQEIKSVKSNLDIYIEEMSEYILLGVESCLKEEKILSALKDFDSDLDNIFDILDEEEICFNEKYFGFYDFSSEKTNAYLLANELPKNIVNDGWSQCENDGYAMDVVLGNAITLGMRDIFKEHIAPEILEKLSEEKIFSFEKNIDKIKEIVLNVIKNNL